MHAAQSYLQTYDNVKTGKATVYLKIFARLATVHTVRINMPLHMCAHTHTINVKLNSAGVVSILINQYLQRQQ